MSAPNSSQSRNSIGFSSALRSPPVIALLLSVTLLFLGEVVRPGFAAYDQITNILRIAAFLGVIAAGQTLVIMAGGEGIDLSVGSNMYLSAMSAD